MTDDVQPGDVLLVRGNGVDGFALRLGQALMGRPSHWDHAALFVGPDRIVEVLSDGVVARRSTVYGDTEHERVYIEASDIDRHRAAAWAISHVGDEYDRCGTIAMLLSRVTPLTIRTRHTYNCASFVGFSLLLCGYPVDPYDLTPGDIARRFGAER